MVSSVELFVNRLSVKYIFLGILGFCTLWMTVFSLNIFYAQYFSALSSHENLSSSPIPHDAQTSGTRKTSSPTKTAPLVSFLRKKYQEQRSKDDHTQSQLDRLLAKAKEVIALKKRSNNPSSSSSSSFSKESGKNHEERSSSRTSLSSSDETHDIDIEDIIYALSLTIGDNGDPSVDTGNGKDDQSSSSVSTAYPTSVTTTTTTTTTMMQSSTTSTTTAFATFPHNPYTQQTCYSQTDESELCVYEGTFCFDGTSPIVILDTPSLNGHKINDYSHTCVDARYYEPGSLEDGGCSYVNTGERVSFNTSAIPNPKIDTPLSLKLRRWGSIYRNGLLLYREMDIPTVYGNQPENTWLPLDRIDIQYHHENAPLSSTTTTTSNGETNGTHTHDHRTYRHPSHDKPSLINDTLILKNGPFTYPNAPDLPIRRRTYSHNITIDWLDTDTSLWLAGLDGQWSSNPYHWFTKIGALYDSQRVNRTNDFGEHPRDGFPQRIHSPSPNGSPSVIFTKDIFSSPVQNLHNPLRWRVGAQWMIPPMDYVVFVGDGATTIPNRESLNDWFRSTLELAIPSTTRSFFNNVLGQLNSNHLLCSTRGGAIPGGKPKLFTGRSDAWLYRQYTYNKFGLPKQGYKSHPRYPPRKITIIDRETQGQNRMIFNKPALIALLNATGLPYEFVPNMGRLSFQQQVTLMAGTGILISPHGAALTNIMFLPAHAVVIEMFPYLMKKLTYRYLASMLDLHYYPYYSWELLPPERTDIYGVKLMNNAYWWNNCIKKNISSYEGLLYHACNGASKNYPIVINPEHLRFILRDAVDTIGAYSLMNPQWKSIADAEGIPIPSPPPYITDSPV